MNEIKKNISLWNTYWNIYLWNITFKTKEQLDIIEEWCVPQYFYDNLEHKQSQDLPEWEFTIEEYHKELKDYSNIPEKSNKFDLKDNYPNIWWKIHLNIAPKDVDKVSEYLINNWFFHKYLNWWDVEDWKIFTIYIWSHKLVKNISKQITKDLEESLLKPKEKKEIELSKWVVWRFVKKGWSSYWTCWFSLKSGFYSQILRHNSPNKKLFEKISFNELYKLYWDYFYKTKKEN